MTFTIRTVRESYVPEYKYYQVGRQLVLTKRSHFFTTSIMRSTFLLLPLLAHAAPSIEKRQLGIFTQAPGAAEKPIKVIKGEASLYDGSVRETQLYGPFKVSAADVQHAKIDPNVLKLDPTSDLVWKGIGGVSLHHIAS